MGHQEKGYGNPFIDPYEQKRQYEQAQAGFLEQLGLMRIEQNMSQQQARPASKPQQPAPNPVLLLLEDV